MHALELMFEVGLHGVRPLASLAGRLHPKLGRAVSGRADSPGRLEAWAAEARDPGRPLLWLHAPSVGEALMAQAIAASARELRPELQVAFTYFSPSAERVAARVGAEVTAYLPWDTRGPVSRALQALRPAVIAFVRTETWPALTRLAARQNVRLAMVNGVLSEDSSRLGLAARALLGPSYARLDRVGAVTAEHAGRFQRLGVRPDRLRVTGDARFDQVWERVQRVSAYLRAAEAPMVADSAPPSPAAAVPAATANFAEPARPGVAMALRLRDPRVFTVVAGSTWPADEEHFLPAFAGLAAERPARLVIAPHEPESQHLESLEHALERAGLRSHTRLSLLNAARDLPGVVIVDSLGILADLYAAADVAYVGGGFHAAGLHSVVEPAALGRPVLFGPRHRAAREAPELAAAGGGFRVLDRDSALERLRALASDAVARHRAGEAAQAYVESQLGGARRNAELIDELIAGRGAAVA